MKSCIVYWLYDETCADPRTDGYIGLTGQRAPKRFSQHEYAIGPYRRVPKNFRGLILFHGSFEECEFLEGTLRPHPFIGWNVIAGGSNSLKRYGIHNFRFGTHMVEEEKQKIRAKIIERGGIENPVPKGTRRSNAVRATISIGTKAAGPLTAEQRQRQIANTQRGPKHHAFGKPMKITNPLLGKDQDGPRNSFFGKKHLPESIAAMSTAANLRWSDPAARQAYSLKFQKTVCKRGHQKKPGKPCIECGRMHAREYQRRKREFLLNSS